MQEEEVLFKEYEALRGEVVAGLTSRSTILSFGFTTLGVILTLAFSIPGTEFSAVVFLLAGPLISGCIMYIWFGEYKRVQNAGVRLYLLERRINEKVGKELLRLETVTRDNRKVRFWYPSVALLMIVAILAVVAGLSSKHLTWCIQQKIVVGIAFFAVFAVIYTLLVWRIHKLRMKKDEPL